MTAAKTLENKKTVKRLLDRITDHPTTELRANLNKAYHRNARWRGSHPLNEMDGVDAIESTVWAPLLNAFPDLERRDSLILGGGENGRDYVGMVGQYAGNFIENWLGIPANNRLVYIRYGEFHQLVDGKIAESTVLMDILHVMRQVGIWPLAKSRGNEEMWPAPITGNGTEMALRDEKQSQESWEFTLGMHKSLDNDIIDREGLLTMSQKEFWHPKMMWYGPCGVGTGRALEGFVDVHQHPFRQTFPKRHYGAEHYVHIGDGMFTATGGWPSVVAKHEGKDWLGIAATGREIEMRVMDFYLIHEGRIRENWVPIDILHILLQMGVDVMADIR